MTNLLSNALEYYEPDTPIEITGRVIALVPAGARRLGKGQRIQMVEMRVRDYGLGIPPEQAPLLFHRFTRLPRDLASAVEGSGSGLYLCKMLCARMNGTIRVESSGIEGEGATFIVRLSLAHMQAGHFPNPCQHLKLLPPSSPDGEHTRLMKRAFLLPMASAWSQSTRA